MPGLGKIRTRWLAGLAVAGVLAGQDARYLQLCSSCHGADAAGTDRGPALARSRRLRARSVQEIGELIRKGTPGGMPAFALPPEELQALAEFVRSMNATAYDAKLEGNAAHGEQFFFGKGRCGSCHMALGRGKVNGPDLSSIAREFTVAELEKALADPSARIAEGYAVIDVRLRDGRTLRGFARREGNHSLQLQTLDGRLMLLLENEYQVVSRTKASLMPPLAATGEEKRALLAYLGRLGGVTPGALTGVTEPVAREAISQVLDPKPGEWPTYYGHVSGNRHSALDQIHSRNVGRLALQWTYTIPYSPLEMTPIVARGVMYVSGPNQVYALDPRTGHEIWRYVRPRTTSGIAGDAILGANRGVAVLGERVFFATDDARMLCLHRLTGTLLWEVYMPEEAQHYGSTAAPLVAGDLVIGGVAGGDQGIRGFIAAYKVTTGELAWRHWTIPGKEGEPGWETWQGTAVERGGGSTWLTGTYDAETNVLYWPTGNPYPDTDGNDRKGDNLYTNCVLALDLATGKMRWHFQFTPHDLHDWDAVQPPVLVDARFHGRERKLLLHANRNGFFYVLDRTNGEFLLAKPLVKRLTWASGIGADGRPQLLAGNDPTQNGTKTCPAVRGATNWYSPAYNPATGLYYVMTVEDCSIYRQSGAGIFGRFVDPAEPAMKYLRALEVETGKIAWEVALHGNTEINYSGVLSTAGGLVFFGETGGGFAAADAKTGRVLWHFESNSTLKASPMTYTVNGRQYVAVAAGSNVLAFALP